jgi:DNA invertase Pin-like site-specific DNA recombinase
MSPKPRRVALYLRVSTDEQDPENQLIQLREFCERWEGHELVAEYVDRESGTRGRRERKEFDRMFADAARRRFDVVLFWALDRFSREGIRKTIAYLERLDACGVAFKSYTEPFLDTDNELIAHIVLGVTSYYAQQEALRISERTKAGLERARMNGKVLGRPDGFERWEPVLARMKEEGFSQGRMSRETGLSYNTVKKYLKRLEASAGVARHGRAPGIADG